MTTILRVIVCSLGIVLLMGETRADEPEKATIGWLEKASAAILVWEHDPEEVSTERARIAVEALIWMRGYFSGVKTMRWADERGEGPAITIIPEKWKDGKTLAAEILSFMRRNPEIKRSGSVYGFMAVFLFLNHPDSTQLHKDMGNAGLAILKGNDPNKAEDLAPSSQQAMNREAINDLIVVERELQKTYDEVLSIYLESDPETASDIRSAQRAWVAFRDAEIRAIFPPRERNGTSGPMVIALEKSLLARKRLAELKVWRNGVEEGNLSAGKRMTPEMIDEILSGRK